MVFIILPYIKYLPIFSKFLIKKSKYFRTSMRINLWKLFFISVKVFRFRILWSQTSVLSASGKIFMSRLFYALMKICCHSKGPGGDGANVGQTSFQLIVFALFVNFRFFLISPVSHLFILLFYFQFVEEKMEKNCHIIDKLFFVSFFFKLLVFLSQSSCIFYS